MRDAPGVPDLQEDFAAFGVNGVSHLAPALDLIGAVETRAADDSVALVGDLRAFGDDQPGARALHQPV